MTLDDLPPEICGEYFQENVLNEVRAHYQDLKSGQRIDAEVKVLFLGNGGVGKTQLCRRLRELKFDPSIPTTYEKGQLFGAGAAKSPPTNGHRTRLF
jgi:GTPase SAR1 family protein